MAVAVPIKDLKETKKFSALVEKNGEVIVTKNGYSAFHCVSAKKREAEKMELAESKLIQRLLIAEEEEKSGKFMDADKVQAKIRAKYDL